jgi:glyoxylase-like metal-dependent hydrolase (beta-lactamase superfamily II)
MLRSIDSVLLGAAPRSCAYRKQDRRDPKPTPLNDGIARLNSEVSALLDPYRASRRSIPKFTYEQARFQIHLTYRCSTRMMPRIAATHAGHRSLRPFSRASAVFTNSGATEMRLGSLSTFVVVALSAAQASSVLAAEPAKPSATIDKLYHIDCGHSLANDESVWTPGENKRKSIEFSSTCYLIQRGTEYLMWDTGVPEATITDPKGWSTLPSLIVYHLDKTISSQLAQIGLKPSDIDYVLVSHTHGDHIGNIALFPDATVVMQQAEYEWISSSLPSDPSLNTLVQLARKLLGHPRRLELVTGDVDLFRDGSVMLLSTPGHTPGSQSLMVHLAETGYVILSGDVAHLEDNFERDIVPSLNVNKPESISSMDRIKQIMVEYNAQLFINHDKHQTETLRLLPEYYD